MELRSWKTQELLNEITRRFLDYAKIKRAEECITKEEHRVLHNELRARLTDCMAMHVLGSSYYNIVESQYSMVLSEKEISNIRKEVVQLFDKK